MPVQWYYQNHDSVIGPVPDAELRYLSTGLARLLALSVGFDADRFNSFSGPGYTRCCQVTWPRSRVIDLKA